jgi:hypothetical protein
VLFLDADAGAFVVGGDYLRTSKLETAGSATIPSAIGNMGVGAHIVTGGAGGAAFVASLSIKSKSMASDGGMF